MFAIAAISLLLAAAICAGWRPTCPRRRRSNRRGRNRRADRAVGRPSSPSASGRKQELIKLGFDAFDALCEAENSDDPEIAMQASYLVRMIRVEWTRDADPRAMQRFSRTTTSRTTSGGCCGSSSWPSCRTTRGSSGCAGWCASKNRPCCRSKRRWRSSPSVPADDGRLVAPRGDDHQEPADGRAAGGQVAVDLRAGARRSGRALPVAGSDRRRAQDARRAPAGNPSQIVMELLRRKVDLLDRLGRGDETADVMRQMVLCERGDSASLGELVDWLVERKAWNVIDEVAARFAASFDLDAMLMYTLCEARLAQGNRELADETAEKALKLNGDNAQEHRTSWTG